MQLCHPTIFSIHAIDFLRARSLADHATNEAPLVGPNGSGERISFPRRWCPPGRGSRCACNRLTFFHSPISGCRLRLQGGFMSPFNSLVQALTKNRRFSGQRDAVDVPAGGLAGKGIQGGANRGFDSVRYDKNLLIGF